MEIFFYSCENTITDNSKVDLAYGCTDYNACNYDGNANVNDGSCEHYDVCDVCGGNASTCINNGVVINEINYRSSDIIFTEDWVEIHNPTNESIAIGMWVFKDNNYNHEFTIPEDQILQSGQYLILCEDTIAFKNYSLDVGNFVADFIGDFPFGLKSEGDQVRLFDSSGLLVDMVEYDDIAPWPTEPNGTGPTLELNHPSSDNTLGQNWTSSKGHGGTPGQQNNVDDDE